MVWGDLALNLLSAGTIGFFGLCFVSEYPYTPGSWFSNISAVQSKQLVILFDFFPFPVLNLIRLMPSSPIGWSVRTGPATSRRSNFPGAEVLSYG